MGTHIHLHPCCTQMCEHTDLSAHSHGNTRTWEHTDTGTHGHGNTRTREHTDMGTHGHGNTQPWEHTDMGTHGWGHCWTPTDTEHADTAVSPQPQTAIGGDEYGHGYTQT